MICHAFEGRDRLEVLNGQDASDRCAILARKSAKTLARFVGEYRCSNEEGKPSSRCEPLHSGLERDNRRNIRLDPAYVAVLAENVHRQADWFDEFRIRRG